jgi:hypothetical protein
MAGLLNAQFACYVRVNFESAFYPAWQKKIPASIFFPGTYNFFPAWKKAYQMARSQSIFLKQNYWRDDYKSSQLG